MEKKLKFSFLNWRHKLVIFAINSRPCEKWCWGHLKPIWPHLIQIIFKKNRKILNFSVCDLIYKLVIFLQVEMEKKLKFSVSTPRHILVIFLPFTLHPLELLLGWFGAHWTKSKQKKKLWEKMAKPQTLLLWIQGSN